jgi:hypothetical protein
VGGAAKAAPSKQPGRKDTKPSASAMIVFKIGCVGGRSHAAKAERTRAQLRVPL